MTYVALLRGINVGGNRKIEMPRLKSMFERLAFDGVRTYINSGNVIFRSRSRDRKALTRKIERAIAGEFGSPVTVLLRTVQEMERLVARIPSDWVNDQQMRCDVLFLWPEFDRRSIVKEFPVNPEVDDVRYLPGAVVWRIDSKNVSRSRRTKIFGTDLYRGLTIRNVNTVRKLAQLMEDAARSAAG